MSNGMARAKELAALADARPAERYLEVKDFIEPQVTTWRWATFVMHSHKPAFHEMAGSTGGRWLPGEPDVQVTAPSRQGVYRTQ